jgi:hypothetical protein
MSVSEWLLQFDEQAYDAGDVQRQKLLQTSREAGPYLRSDPARALALYEQGRRLAESLNEPWWVMYFTHWKLQVLLYYLADYQHAQRFAVEATLEARKPAYTGLPQRVCLHDDLVNSYVGTDPKGNACAIQEALAFMQADVAPLMECRYCIQGDAADFALATGSLNGAETACQHILDMAEDETSLGTRAHHCMTAEARLCEVAFLRQDWTALAEHADAGADWNPQAQRPMLLAEFLMWQALLARRKGEDRQGEALVHRAEDAVARNNAVPRGCYFDALCAYRLEAKETELALKVREHELKLIAGKGMLQREANGWLQLCRLRRQLGLPLEESLMKAREAAHRLRRPEEMLAELTRLGGEMS